jgi:pyrroline-5-carboxylate reductase
MIIGFIGAGVMARALGNGLVQGGGFSAKDLICSAPTVADGQPFLDQFPGSRWTPSNREVVQASDLTILAVKPQVLAEAMAELKEISSGKLFLSIAAGVTLEKIRGWLAPTARVVRAMPNTPMQVGAGASVYAGGPNVTEADLALVHRILSAAGKAWPVEENQIDTVTALSGSGPAYVFHFMDALIRGAVALGLPEAQPSPVAPSSRKTTRSITSWQDASKPQKIAPKPWPEARNNRRIVPSHPSVTKKKPVILSGARRKISSLVAACPSAVEGPSRFSI